MLGKRQQSKLMSQTTSVASLPSVAKRIREASGGDMARAVEGGGGGAALRKTDGGVMMAASFLAACASCGKGLGPGKDTYIYRGEVAFCSQECREWHIEQERVMERNRALTSSSREAATTPPSALTSLPGTSSPTG